jgi:hypothetical protein
MTSLSAEIRQEADGRWSTSMGAWPRTLYCSEEEAIAGLKLLAMQVVDIGLAQLQQQDRPLEMAPEGVDLVIHRPEAEPLRIRTTREDLHFFRSMALVGDRYAECFKVLANR